MPKLFNLSALADALRPSRTHRKLVGVIDRWAHRNSRAADLKQAQDLLKQIECLGVLAGDPQLYGDVQGALFANAIILYARAAEDGDKGRRHAFDVKALLSPELCATHATLVALRKTAIAHFDSEQRQTWNRDSVLLVVRSHDAWEYGFSHSRTMFEAKLYARFVELLDVVCPQVHTIIVRENDDLHAALEDALREDPSLRSELDKHEFDAEKFYQGGIVAENFAAAIETPGSGMIANVTFPLN